MSKLSIQDGLEALDSFLTINGHVLSKTKSNRHFLLKGRVEAECKICGWLYDFYPEVSLINLAYTTLEPCGIIPRTMDWFQIQKLASQFSEMYEGQWQ